MLCEGQHEGTTPFIAISLLQGKLGTVLYLFVVVVVVAICLLLFYDYHIPNALYYHRACISSSKIKSLALILQIFGEYFAVTPTRLLQLQNDLLVICLLYMPTLPAIIVPVNLRCTGLDSVRDI